MRLAYPYLVLALGLLSFQTNAAECTARSGNINKPLLELYTSEGCSSCPPADHWLSELKDTDQVVPLAFHVDYWDYIGWQDRFAKPAFTARQKHAAAENGSTFVYTPQVIINGRDFRGWRQDSGLESAIYRYRQPADGQLSLNMVSDKLKVTAQTQDREADVYIAIFENGLTSKVNAGENSGRELKHDFVVREWYGPFPLQDMHEWQRTLELKPSWKGRDGGAAAFIQNRRSGEVLQALNLKFCG
ncbi:MAG TPA: DUF1223 domain-containing protein [Methylophilaceae bacterium]|nr:DUF1223 domain-containing protein [Methylophilaceae bacterium]